MRKIFNLLSHKQQICGIIVVKALFAAGIYAFKRFFRVNALINLLLTQAYLFAWPQCAFVRATFACHMQFLCCSIWLLATLIIHTHYCAYLNVCHMYLALQVNFALQIQLNWVANVATIVRFKALCWKIYYGKLLLSAICMQIASVQLCLLSAEQL